VQNNATRIREFAGWYQLPFDLNSGELNDESFWDKTIIGQRRELADLIRLQLYGVLWEATGIDQYYPESFTPAQRDLLADDHYYQFEERELNSSDLAFKVIDTGKYFCGDATKLIIINEPIMISTGEHSDIRYNFYYPRWAYDQYRSLIHHASQSYGWEYYDLWDIIPENEFTNSAIHLTPTGESILANAIKDILVGDQGFLEK
jgi:hypothetical protein